jgi:hypothetical protein
MTRKRNPPRIKVPKTTDKGVYKISVQSTVYDGCWIKEIDGDIFRLHQINENQLALEKNGIDTGGRFKLYEREITHIKLKNPDKRFIYCVEDNAGKRFRFLYLYKSPNGRFLGTQKQCGLRHASSCMSKLQRKEYAAARKIRHGRRLELRKQRQEIRIARKIADYRLRFEGSVSNRFNAELTK